jgi:hypothetical protein
MFKQNEGKLDRTIRMVAGVLSLYLSLFVLDGVFKTIALVLGIVLVITGSLGFCGLYTLLGINTCPIKVKTVVRSKKK